MHLCKNYIHTHTHTHTSGSVRAHRTKGVTGSKGLEILYGVGGGVGGESRVVDGNAAGGGIGDVNGDGDRTGAG